MTSESRSIGVIHLTPTSRKELRHGQEADEQIKSQILYDFGGPGDCLAGDGGQYDSQNP